MPRFAILGLLFACVSPARAQTLIPRDPDLNKARAIVHTAAYNHAFREARASLLAAEQVREIGEKARLLNSQPIRTAAAALRLDTLSYRHFFSNNIPDSAFARTQANLRIQQLADMAAANAPDVVSAQTRKELENLQQFTLAELTVTASIDTRAGTIAEAVANEAKKEVATVGGAPWVDQAILGLASFVASRAEASLLGALAQDASRRICGNQRTSPFVPATCLLLASENAAPAWGMVRMAVVQDLQTLPDSVAGAALRDVAKVLPGADLFASATIQSVRLMERGEDPIRVLAGLTSFGCHQTHDQCTSIGNALYALGSATELVFADARIGTDPEALAQAVDLLLKALSGGSGIPQDQVDPLTARLTSSLRELNTRLQRLQQIAQTVKSAPTAREYAQLAAALVRVLEMAPDLRLSRLNDQDAATFLKLAGSVRHLNEAINSAREKEWGRLFIEAQAALLPWRSETMPIPPFFTTYGPVLVQLASDTSAAAIKATLQTAAAPLGSYKIKRGDETRGITRPLGINAYVGANIGREALADARTDEERQFGLFAPVGFEASVGFWEKPAMSLSIFVSVIDLGGLLTFRANGDTALEVDSTRVVEDDPQIGFKQIVSPGLYLVLGVSKSVPLSIGGGVSLHPGLRRIRDETTGESKTTSTRRIAIFGAVDVPLFRL